MSLRRRPLLSLALLAPGSAFAQMVNPSFDDGLIGWTSSQVGGIALPGSVIPVTSAARLLEGDSFLVELSQTFVLLPRTTTISFDLTQIPGFDTTGAFIPDAFEARLLGASGLSVVMPWRDGADAFFTLQEDGTPFHGPGVTFDGRTVTVDTSAVPAFSLVTLSFTLVGGDVDSDGGVTLDGMNVTSNNRAPVADAGDDATVECGVPFTLDGSGSLDPDGDALGYRWTRPTDVLVGANVTEQATLQRETVTYTLTVSDVYGVSDDDTVVITAVDSLGPTIDPLPPVTRTVDVACTAAVPDLTAVAEVADACGQPVFVSQDPVAGVRLAPGSYTITVNATDGANLTSLPVAFEVLDDAALCTIVDTDTVDTDGGGVVIETGDTGDTDTDTDTDVVDTPADTDTDVVDTPADTDTTDTLVDTPVDTLVDTPIDTDTVIDTPIDTDTVVDTPIDTVIDTPIDTDLPVDTDLESGNPRPESGNPDDTDTDTVPDNPGGDDTDDTTGDGDKDPGDGPGECGCDTANPNPAGPGLLAAAWLAVRRRRKVLAASLLAAMAPGTASAHHVPNAPLPLDLGVVASGVVDDDEEVETWSFFADPGQVIYLQQTSAPNFWGMTWRLLDAYGRVVAETSWMQDLGRVTLMGGAYTLEVFAYSGQSGAYSVVAWPVTDVSAPGEVGADLAGEIRPPSERDHWALSLPGGPVYVDIPSSNAYGAWVGLRNPYGELVSPWAWLTGTGPLRTLPGDYTLDVQGYGANTLTYTAKVRALTTTTGSVAAGQTADVTIESANADAVWQISVPADGLYALVTSDLANPYTVAYELVDPFGQVVANSAYLFNIDRIGLVAGTYTLRMWGAAGSFHVRCAPITDVVAPISLGDAITFDASVLGTRGRYSFHAPAGTRLIVDGSATPVYWAWRYTVEDALGRVVTSADDIYLHGPTPLAEGDYTFVLQPDPNYAGIADFKLRNQAISVGALTLGAPVSGAITAPGDEASYAFTVVGDRVVDFTVDATDNYYGLQTQIVDGLGRAIVPWTYDFFAVTGMRLRGGSYRLQVRGEGLSMGTYTVRLTDVGPATSSLGGLPLADGETVTAAVTAGSPVRYALTVPFDSGVYFDLLAATWPTTWTLTDAAGQPVFSSAAHWLDGYDQGPLMLRAGAYTLELATTDVSSAYSLTWHTLPPVTAPLTLGVPVSEALTLSGEVRGYLLHLDAPTSVFFDAQGAAGRTRWGLYDALGNTVFNSGFDWAGYDQGPYTLAAGDWKVAVSGDYGAVGTFTFAAYEGLTYGGTISLDTPVVASIPTPGGVWRGTFTAMGGERVLLDLTQAQYENRWSLIDPLGNRRFDHLDVNDPNGSDRGPFTLTPGTWTIEVDENYQQTGDIGFTVRTVHTTTHTASFDTLASGTLAGPGDADVWTLHVDQATRAYLDSDIGNYFAGWTVTDPAGQVRVNAPNLNDPHANDVGPLVLEPGDWTIRVSAIAATPAAYSFTWRTVADESLEAPLGVEIAGTVRGPGAVTSYTFTVDESTPSLSFDLLAGDYWAYWSVLDPVGQPVFASTNMPDPDSGDRGPYKLAPGTYTVLIDPQYDYTPSWRFKIAVDNPDARSFYYTRYGGAVKVKRAAWSYEGGVLEILGQFRVASTPGADGLVIAPDGDLLVGGGNQYIYKIDVDTGEYTQAWTGGAAGLHIALDPSGTKIWTAGVPGLLAELPLTPFGDGVTRAVVGDDSLVTHLAFDRTGRAWYTASAPSGYGSFGRIDMATLTTTRLYGGMAAAHGLAFDPFTDHLIMTGANHITQVDPETGLIVADLVVGGGVNFDQGTVDGGGHVFAADNNGSLVFVDYAATGLVDHPANYTYNRFLDSYLDDVAPLSWLGSACAGVPRVTGLVPAAGTTLTPGSHLVLTGTVTGEDPTRPVTGVIVNGQSATVDASGRFFLPITIDAGENLFTLEAIDRCGTAQVDLRLTGSTSVGGDALAGFHDASASLRASFKETSFATSPDQLIVNVSAHNTGGAALVGPILMAVGSDLPASVALANAGGTTTDGMRFVQVLGAGETLPADASTAPVPLVLHNPDRVKVAFTPRWLVPDNQPPRFDSVPALRARTGVAWSYDADATDPEGGAVAFSLPVAPPGAGIDGSGRVSWTPGAAGVYEFAIVATDALGSSATQSFSLEVAADPGNAPPVITSAPPMFAAVGAPFVYDPSAADVDGDALSWSLDGGPSGMTVDPSTGAVRWDFALPGTYELTLTADDGHDGAASQSWSLSVGSLPTGTGAPQITSAPPLLGAVANVYVYQPYAVDPDGDAFTWSLVSGPEGMVVDPITGRVLWTPAEVGDGTEAVVLQAADAEGSARQLWTISVGASMPDRAPIFSTVPPATAVVGVPYRYNADAVDPEASTVLYAAAEGPIAVEPNTGVLTFTPVNPGFITLGLTAADEAGHTSSQVFLVEVRATNADPSIYLTTTDDEAYVGEAWSVDLGASDADGDRLTFSIVDAPPGVTVDPRTGLVSWTPELVDEGDHVITVEVHDAFGGSAQIEVPISVVRDVTPPVVDVFALAEPACAGEPVTLCVGASDAVGVESRSLTVDGAPLALDALGCAPFTSASALLQLGGAAVDSTGNVGSVAIELPVIDCHDANAPVVTIVSPVPAARLSSPEHVFLQVTDNAAFGLTWTLSIARHGSEDWRQIAEGTGPIDGDAGLLDTTVLTPGDWDLRVVAYDGVNFNDTRQWVSVENRMRFGETSVAFNDVQLDLLGIPLTVGRSYSSFDLSEGDFGTGWQLMVTGAVTDTPFENNGEGDLLDLFDDEAFPNGGRVYVTKADGQTVGFTLSLSQASPYMPFFKTVSYEPDPGVEDTLEAVGTTVVADYGSGAYNYIYPYNPSTYILTTPDGVRWSFNEELGLLRVDDVYGNFVTVDSDGLHHSTGVDVVFERDAQDRISRVIEPDDADDTVPQSIHSYGYDANNNLVTYTDPTGVVSTYGYELPSRPNLLTSMAVGGGAPFVRVVYDEEGRQIATCGPTGNVDTLDGCAQSVFVPEARTATTIDAEGNLAVSRYSAAGDLIRKEHLLDDGSIYATSSTYDEGHRLLSRTFGAETFSWTYGDDGKLLTATTPDGSTSTWTWSGCEDPASTTDADGNTWTYTFTPDCEMLTSTDPLGHTTTRTRDAYGRLVGVTDDRGRAWTFEVDDQGHQTAIHHPGGASQTFTYNTAGDPLSQTDARGNTSSFTYDASHRLLREDRSDGTSTVQVWGAAGKLDRVTDEHGELRFGWRPDGKVDWQELAPVGGPATRLDVDWSPNGKLALVDDGRGGVATYVWDAVGRKQAMGWTVPEGEAGLAFDYDGQSRVTGMRRFADAARTVPAVDTTIAYLPGRDVTGVLSIEHRTALGDLIAGVTYTRGAENQVTGWDDAEGHHAVLSDGLHRVLGVDNDNPALPDESYAYDAGNNRTASHLSAALAYAPGTDLLVGDDTFQYTYDPDGALTERVVRATGLTEISTWNGRGQLIAQRSELAGNVVHSAVFAYDPLGRRMLTELDGVRRWTVHVDQNPVLTLDDAGAVLGRRLYGGTLDEVYAEARDGRVQWLLTDAQGSVRDVVDTTGALLAHVAYDSYGRRLSGPAPGVVTELGYVGRPTDALTGYVDMRARMYDPETGRFTSRDPVQPFGWTYVHGSPLDLRDPTGKSVLIEYACLAVGAVNNAMSLSKNYGTPLQALYEDIALEVSLRGDGSSAPQVKAVVKGIYDALNGFMFPSAPETAEEAGMAVAGGLCNLKDFRTPKKDPPARLYH